MFDGLFEPTHLTVLVVGVLCLYGFVRVVRRAWTKVTNR